MGGRIMSDMLDSIYEMVKGLNKTGCLSNEKLEEFREICLPSYKESLNDTRNLTSLVINGYLLPVERVGRREYKADYMEFYTNFAEEPTRNVTYPMKGVLDNYSIAHGGGQTYVVFKVI